MKSTAKDVILLCKGWYDEEKYQSKLEALKEYYRRYYNDDMDEFLNEEFLVKTVLADVIREIQSKYKDRFVYIINCICNIDPFRLYISIPDSSNENFYYQLFYRIIGCLGNMRMHGDGLTEIDTDDYFIERVHLDGEHEKKLRIDII